jgi:hypothetical protein
LPEFRFAKNFTKKINTTWATLGGKACIKEKKE